MTSITSLKALRLSPIVLIVAGALLLRLIFVLLIDPHPKLTGGDTNWYMEVGRDIATTGTTKGPIQTPPLYSLLLGVVQRIMPGDILADRGYSHTDVQTVRIFQAFLGATVCLFVYLIANRLFSRRVGLWSAGLLAISPAFVIEAGNVVSESLFLFCLYAGVALYAHASNASDQIHPRHLLGVGALLALATLTRAVSLIFPAVIIAHLFFRDRQRWLRLSACLLLGYVPLISTWTIYNLIEWDRLIIGGEGLLSFLYQGAEGTASPQQLDEQLNVTVGEPGHDIRVRNEAMKREVQASILDNPIEWTGYRVKQLVSAYLQPHNTTYFGGRSIKDAASSWLREDRSLRGLRDIGEIQGFVPKLLLYLFHYGALLLGAAGMIVLARRWRALLALYGMVIYFTGIHLVLLVLPRYLFPIMPIFYLFGCAIVVWGWDKRRLQVS